MVSSKHHLGVIDQVEGEHQSSTRSIDQLQHLTLTTGNSPEDHDDPKHQHEEGEAEHDAAAGGEVHLGLDGEGGEEEGDSGGETNCNEDFIDIMESRDHPNHDALEDGKEKEDEVVVGDISAESFDANHREEKGQSERQAGPEKPHVVDHKQSAILDKQEETDGTNSDGKLAHQDGIHFADEPSTD